MALTIKTEKLLPASPTQVMQMLTEQAEIEKWSGEETVFDAKVGGKVSLFGGWMNGEVKEISDSKLTYTWRTAEWLADVADSIVAFDLMKDGDQTKLILEHSNLPNEDEVKSHKQGWEDFFFTPLEDYLMVKYNAD
ncbi:MAG: SRPBCC domain-containing protein [Chitinophagaceae bacterium]|nr:SRPBCC domain-containing protein [Chitinophagaceae bacterium]